MSDTKPRRAIYFDKDEKRQALTETTAERLAYIAKHGRSGSFTLKWSARDVRHGEDRGLWRVEWLERSYGDEKREGAYVIHELTEVGRIALGNWNRGSDDVA